MFTSSVASFEQEVNANATAATDNRDFSILFIVAASLLEFVKISFAVIEHSGIESLL